MVNANDIRWLAGYLEGEGYFISGYPPGVRPRIGVKTTDLDVAQRVGRLFEANVRPVRSNEGRLGKKQLYTVEANSSKAIGWMMTLYSLLGKRRKEQIRLVLTNWKSRRAEPGRVGRSKRK